MLGLRDFGEADGCQCDSRHGRRHQLHLVQQLKQHHRHGDRDSDRNIFWRDREFHQHFRAKFCGKIFRRNWSGGFELRCLCIGAVIILYNSLVAIRLLHVGNALPTYLGSLYNRNSHGQFLNPFIFAYHPVMLCIYIYVFFFHLEYSVDTPPNKFPNYMPQNENVLKPLQPPKINFKTSRNFCLFATVFKATLDLVLFFLNSLVPT